jgi:15-cis-phytoene synthase
MEILSQIDLANFEKQDTPEERQSNFYLSFSFLPSEIRNSIKTVYSFCSYIDNIVDCSPNNNDEEKRTKLRRLGFWERTIESLYTNKRCDKLIIPLKEVISRYSIPKQYFFTLIDGCRRDIMIKRYKTFEELKDYCYGVASIVGLISIEIFGHKYEETKEYAINLGYALQLTNIMRDIKEDKNRGYIYIPLEDLARFNYSENDLKNEVYNENFIELMRFQAKRVREFYHKARKSLRPDERPTVIAAEIMDTIYYRLLEKIELNEFNVFAKRIKVSWFHKFLTAFKRWLDIKVFVKRIKKSNY